MAPTTQISEIGVGGILRGRRLPEHVLTYTVYMDAITDRKIVRWMTSARDSRGYFARVTHEMPLDESDESLTAVLAAMQLTD